MQIEITAEDIERYGTTPAAFLVKLRRAGDFMHAVQNEKTHDISAGLREVVTRNGGSCHVTLMLSGGQYLFDLRLSPEQLARLERTQKQMPPPQPRTDPCVVAINEYSDLEVPEATNTINRYGFRRATMTVTPQQPA